MLPWWPSAWTSARHYHNKEGVSSSRSLLAPTSPSPWTPRRLGMSQTTRPRRGAALRPREEMQSAERNFWVRSPRLKLLLLLEWGSTRSNVISFIVTIAIQHSKQRMAWKFTRGNHTRKTLGLKRSEILPLNLPWSAPPSRTPPGLSPATTVAWICPYLTSAQVINIQLSLGFGAAIAPTLTAVDVIMSTHVNVDNISNWLPFVIAQTCLLMYSATISQKPSDLKANYGPGSHLRTSICICDNYVSVSPMSL